MDFEIRPWKRPQNFMFKCSEFLHIKNYPEASANNKRRRDST